jgi:flagellar protein FlbD
VERQNLPSPFSLLTNMIKVTRLDGMEYFINPHQIESIEIRPDTILVMLSGKHHIVKEEVDEVIQRIEGYRRRLNPFKDGE